MGENRLPLRFGLRRFFLTIALICGATGCISAACLGGGYLAAAIGVFLLGLGIGTLIQRIHYTISIVCAIAFISCLTTTIQWDGGYPLGMIKINVIDENRVPIQGAELTVFDQRTRKSAYRRPFREHLEDSKPTSDMDGAIKCRQLNPGFQFGGQASLLFWLIPIGAQGPEHVCIITHPDFEPVRLPLWQLFESAARTYEDSETTIISLTDEEVNLTVFETDVEMKRRQ
jgi:hypothetical protein